MTYPRMLLFSLGFILLISTAFARSEKPAKKSDDPISKVETAFQDGTLSYDDKARLQIMAIKDPDQLPAEFQRTDQTVSKTNGHSATPAIVDIIQHWDVLSPTTRAYITQALSRPTASYSFDSPSGFFTLHYDLSGVDAVSSTDSDSDGTPDYIEACAAYLDSSITRHRELGYRDPPVDHGAGGDDKFDCYFESMGYYGYAVPEGPGPEAWNDYYSYLVLHNTYIGFPPNDDPEGNAAGAAKATAAHELHHCVQFAYDVNEPAWFMECDATYMEDIVFDHVDDNYNYLDNFMDSPETSLMDNGMHAYASFIWPMFLAEKFDTLLLVAVWEGARYDGVYDVTSDSLEAYFGWTQDSAFAEFAFWNFATGSRDDGLHHSEAADYDQMTISASHSTYPVSVSLAPFQPQGYAASYVQFWPGAEEGILQLEFNGSDARQWAALVIKSAAENVHSMELIDLSPGTFEGTVTVPGFEDYLFITLVAVNLSEFAPGGTFSYSANVLLPDMVRAEILTDTAAYAGETRLYQCKVVSLVDQADVFEIHSWDSRNWIDSGRVDRYILAGDSTVVDVAVSPSDTETIYTRSDLQFRAQLKTEPLAYDQHSISAVIVPKRGDVNLSGNVTLSDITALISYVYIEGPAPDPFEIGDFNCSGDITLSDIAGVIDMVYISKNPSDCDPFLK